MIFSYNLVAVSVEERCRAMGRRISNSAILSQLEAVFNSKNPGDGAPSRKEAISRVAKHTMRHIVRTACSL